MAQKKSGKDDKRGFAGMDEEKQREIASKGGKASHEKGTGHEFTPEEAREAGRKGGEAVSKDREHMADIGREGGRARGRGNTGGNRGGGREESNSENEGEEATAEQEEVEAGTEEE
jgi:uncharacterized protein